MNPFLKKMMLALKRHPLLYLIRYLLLSKNCKDENADAIGCYNDSNSVSSVPKLYFEINEKIKLDGAADELKKAMTIGIFLRNAIKVGPGIGLSSEKTLQKMMTGYGGVCSDFSQIFNVFCLINDIRVKEWGCIDHFYKTKFGHSFNEIYSTKLKKWIAIDIHKGLVFKDENENYLSTIELFTSLRNGKKIEYFHYSDYVSRKPERIPLVYNAITIPFIIDNKKSSEVDYYLDKFNNKFSTIVINAMLILTRKTQRFIFVLDNYKSKLWAESKFF